MKFTLQPSSLPLALVLSGLFWLCFHHFGYSLSEAAELPVSNKLKIEGVYFFGYDGLDLKKIEHDFSLKPGAVISEDEWFESKRQALADEIRRLVGKAPTDIALIQIAEGHIVFVGLPGKSNIEEHRFNVIGKEKIAAPLQVCQTYFEMMELLPAAVERKSKQDLDAYLSKRKKLIEQALASRAALVSATGSSDTNDRIVASYALGLIATSKDELLALVKLSDDPNSTVRNNSTRELGELLLDKADLAKEIPAGRYIEMLNSPTWTDRNKSVFLLLGLSKSRDPKILAEMREKALPSLIEMCKWPSGYSESAIELLGRIAGIPEDRLKVMREKNDAREVLKALKLE